MNGLPAPTKSRLSAGRHTAVMGLVLLLATLLAGCSAGNTGCDEFLRQSADQQRDTVRRALDQREMWSPTLEGTTRELVILCQFDSSASLSQVLDRAGVPDESSLFRGASLAVILIAVGVGGTIAAKVMDNQRTGAPAAAGSPPGPSPLPASGPPSPTPAVLQRDPRLARALELGNVHYRIMWLIIRRPPLTQSALRAASNDTNAEVTEALDDLATHGLVRLLPDNTLQAAEKPPPNER